MRSPLARQIVALGLALAVVALSLAYPLRGYLQQQAAERAATAEQHELESQISDLQAQAAALKDPSYIRAEAKRRLQYVTQGDTVYVVKVPESVRPPSEAQAGAAAPGATPLGAVVSGSIGADTAGSAAPPASGSAPAPGSAAASGEQPWYRSLWSTLSGSGQ